MSELDKARNQRSEFDQRMGEKSEFQKSQEREREKIDDMLRNQEPSWKIARENSGDMSGPSGRHRRGDQELRRQLQQPAPQAEIKETDFDMAEVVQQVAEAVAEASVKVEGYIVIGGALHEGRILFEAEPTEV